MKRKWRRRSYRMKKRGVDVKKRGEKPDEEKRGGGEEMWEQDGVRVSIPDTLETF